MRYRIYILLAVNLISFPLASARAQTVSGTDFRLYGQGGLLTAQLTTSGEGTPALFLYDANRVPRISIGVYADGAPGVVLNDSAGQAAAIMRLVNSAGGPVVVLKENGQDKVIIDKNGVPGSNNAYWPGLFAGFFGGLLGGVVLMGVNRKTESVPA